MHPPKKELIKALKETRKDYLYDRKASSPNKSIEWRICRLYKGDCIACIWAQFKDKNFPNLFPCQTRRFLSAYKPSNPSSNLKRLLIANMLKEVKILIEEIHYAIVISKTELFRLKISRIFKNLLT